MEQSFRNVLITGASSGLGRGLALYFAKRGARVYAAARRTDRLDTLRTELQSGAGSIVPLSLDIGRPEETIERLGALDTECGGLDLVVANAGVGAPSDGRSLDWKTIAPVMQVNVAGTVATITAVLPKMVERNRGHIAAVSSLAGLSAMPRNGVYSASKAFVSMFMEGLRLDLAQTNVRVTVIHPGFVKSEMTAKNRFRMPFLLETEDAVERMGRALVRGRPELSFPWQISSAARVARLLPNSVRKLAANSF